MRLKIIFLALLFPMLVYGQWGTPNPRDIILGFQTTGDGLYFRGSGKPTFIPTTNQNPYIYIDTTNTGVYYWESSKWIRLSVHYASTAPKPGTSTTRDSLNMWYNSADSNSYTYSIKLSAWVPSSGVYIGTSAPANVAAGVSNGAIIYDRSFWYDTSDSTYNIYSDGSWVEISPQTLAYNQTLSRITISNGNHIDLPAMLGATPTVDGIAGLVPKPVAGQDTMFLAGDGTWKPISALSSGGDAWGSQVVQTDNSLQGTGILGDPLGVKTTGAVAGYVLKFNGSEWVPAPDSLYSGEASATDEIQTLSLVSTALSLSLGGGTISLAQTFTYIQDSSNLVLSLTRANDLTLPEYVGATGSTRGRPGLVPEAAVGQQDLFLKGDGTWTSPSITNVAVETNTTIDGDGTVPSPLGVNAANTRSLLAVGTYKNDGDAATNGVAVGEWYYLAEANTLGLSYGTLRKRVY